MKFAISETAKNGSKEQILGFGETFFTKYYKYIVILFLMDPRKIIKFGNSSYVVTLPNEWVKKHKLDKGSQVFLSERGDSLMVNLRDRHEEKKSCRRT